MTTLIHKTSADLPREKSGGHVVETLRVPHITLHAYCDTPEMIGTMERAVADRRMSRAHATIHPGGIAAAVDLYRQDSVAKSTRHRKPGGNPPTSMRSSMLSPMFANPARK